jgi:phosphatidylinositol-3,4,5-trisphosphate 5-phosphatase 1
MSPFQEAEAIIQKIKQQQYSDLLAHDQLLLERKDQKVFLHFGEGTLSLLCIFSFHLLSTWTS